MPANWIGIDIGGANIKLANERLGLSVPFQLWKHPNLLQPTLVDLVGQLGGGSNLAITMTGELADCFPNRRSGVEFICDSIFNVVKNSAPCFYQTTGCFVDAERAKRDWRLTAAANWHAMASVCGKSIRNGIMIDIGSTTTDIVPIVDGAPVTIGKTDLSRIQNNELVYTGVVRTPVCAVVETALLENTRTRLAAEFFATMQDVYVVLGKIREDESSRHTADDRPATKEYAASRLARMLCTDASEFTAQTIRSLADQIAARQKSIITHSIDAISERHPHLNRYIVLGEGSWLAREIVEQAGHGSRQVIELEEIIDSTIDAERLREIGPAYAMLELAKCYVL